MPLCYTLGEQGGRWARCKLAQSLVCLLPPPNCVISWCFFFPVNGFYLNFKALPSLSRSVFFFLLCMVMPLEQNRPWNQNGPGKGNRFSWFLHFTSQSPTAERPSVLACRFTARWEAYLLVSKSLATPPPPITIMMNVFTYFHTLWCYTKPWHKDL